MLNKITTLTALAVLGLSQYARANDEDVIPNGNTTTYNFTREEQYDVLARPNGLSFNEFWGLIVNKPKYCQGDDACLSQPIESGRCLVSTKPIELVGSGEISAKVEFSVTGMEWVFNPYQIESKPMLTLQLTGEVDGRSVELASTTVHLLDLPFRFEGTAVRGSSRQTFFSTNGFDTRTLARQVTKAEGARNIKLSLCNAGAFNLNMKKVQIVTKLDL